MTQKRFIKILMSKGVSRNRARWWAKVVIRSNAYEDWFNTTCKRMHRNQRLKRSSYREFYDSDCFRVVVYDQKKIY